MKFKSVIQISKQNLTFSVNINKANQSQQAYQCQQTGYAVPRLSHLLSSANGQTEINGYSQPIMWSTI